MTHAPQAMPEYDRELIAKILEHGTPSYSIHTCIEQAELLRASLAAPPASVRGLVDWTDDQCAEFMSVAMRHCKVKGEFTWDDIRMGQRRANALAPADAGGEGESLRDWSARMGDKEIGQYVGAGSHGIPDEQSPTPRGDGAVAEYQYRCPLARDASWRRMSKTEYEETLRTGHACGNLAWTRDVEVRKLYTHPAPDAADVGDRQQLQRVLNLTEAARCLGVAQAKNDAGAIEYWTTQVALHEATLRQSREKKP